jgi:bifunctional UDP-N-acetylglucosamine pyrophosphorylase/glucosamine-1-phosphate N-acetyltransferase
MARIIILAAGKGKRMRSDLPKVLIPFGGVPMVEHVLTAAEQVCLRPIVVVGHRADEVIAALGPGRDYAVQEEQRGTGDAVLRALRGFTVEEEAVVVLPGDHPLITAKTIRGIIAARAEADAAVAMATLRLPDFDGWRGSFSECGRILRSADGGIIGIVERKDADVSQAGITEVNVSYYCFRGGWLKENVERIVSDNAAGEYYLTDLVAAAALQGERVVGVPLEDAREGMGVNTPEQLLAAASREA